MAIINTPITLPANFYYSTISQMILERQVVDDQNIADWQDQLHAYFNKGGFANGNGRIYTYGKDKTNPTLDRPVQGSGTPVTTPINPYGYRNVKEFFETTINVDKRELTLITYDLLGTTNQSFSTSNNQQEFLALILDSNEYTIRDKFSQIELGIWNTDVGVNAKQTYTIDTYDMSVITDPSTKQWAYQQNSINIKKGIDKLMDSLTVKTTGGFTNEATQTTQYKKADLKAIFNKYWVREIAAGGVQMYNEEAINYMLPSDLTRIALPEDVVTDPLRIATIQTNTRHNLFEGYRAGYPLINPVLADQTNFEHYEYGTGVVKYAGFVEIKASNTLTV